LPGAVVDTSFVIAVLVDEEHTAFARETFATLVSAGMSAPGLLAWEMASVLQKKDRQGRISPAQRAALVEGFEDFAVSLRMAPDLSELGPLLALSDRYGLTAYDAAYLLLALEEQAALASIDNDLVRAARAEGLTVHAPF
jgi:predicted nucleic acid-binding protein